MKNKVAFIGPEVIHESFRLIDENWDFQSPIETLSEFENELASVDENSKISQNTSVIILFSRLFAENREQFSRIVALLAPYSAICILHPDSDGEENKEIIQQTIKEQQRLFAEESDEYSIEDPFYFVAYESPQEGINEALSRYVRDPRANPESRQNILASMPDDIARTLQTENDVADIEFGDGDLDRIEIPERSEEANGRVVAVTSSKGGSGKSSISMLLAAYLAKGSRLAVEQGLEAEPLKVCVVDFDVRDGQLGFLNGVTSGPTVVDILGAGGFSQENVSKGIWHSPKMECDFIFAAKRPRYAQAIPPDFYAALIQTLREMYDYIILDTSVNYLDPLLENVAYPMADKIIFVTDVNIASIFGMARWMKETTVVEEGREPIDHEKIGIVVNKVLKDVAMPLDKIQAAGGNHPILSAFPSVPSLLTYAANTQTLEQALNMKQINVVAKRLADSLVNPTGYKLAELPSH